MEDKRLTNTEFRPVSKQSTYDHYDYKPLHESFGKLYYDNFAVEHCNVIFSYLKQQVTAVVSLPYPSARITHSWFFDVYRYGYKSCTTVQHRLRW